MANKDGPGERTPSRNATSHDRPLSPKRRLKSGLSIHHKLSQALKKNDLQLTKGELELLWSVLDGEYPQNTQLAHVISSITHEGYLDDGVRAQLRQEAKRYQMNLEFSSKDSPDAKTFKPSPRHISKDTAESLTMLDQQIEAAEKHLKKMPGAREFDTRVVVEDILSDDHQPRRDDSSWELLLWEGELTAAMIHYNSAGEGLGLNKQKRIRDYPTKEKIKLAGRIPDLIKVAKAAESGLKKMSDEAIAEIQKAIEASLEVYDEQA